MKNGYSLEVLRRVYDDSEGVYLEVSPDADTTSCVELRTLDEESKKFYGAIRLPMPPQQARLLGSALIACADELDEASKLK